MPTKVQNIKKRRSDRGRLIKRHWEEKPAAEFQDALGSAKRGQGIYVLFDGYEVYYIGLSKRSMRGRIKAHATRDRHKGLWDRFSFYQIGRTRLIKDVESLLLRILKPPGNSVRGRFPSRYNLGRPK